MKLELKNVFNLKVFIVKGFLMFAVILVFCFPLNSLYASGSMANLNEFIISKNFQEVTVSGVVVDKDGVPLPGANVSEKGTSNGTQTDFDGKFSLIVSGENAILSISFMGFVTTDVPVEGRETLSITLEDSAAALDEVVVVGYGTQSRRDVTAAIASVPMDEIKDMPVSNVAIGIQGKVPGVQIQQTSGAPGSTPSIKVRGFGSISAGSDPLIVVDGNMVSAQVFNLINPNEIESIDILKDASSTAIYGSRGSNGVVMVTTSRGKAGRHVVTLDMYTGFQEISNQVDMLNSEQFAEFSREAANNAYLDNVPGATPSDPNDVRPGDYLRYRYPRGENFEWLNFDDPSNLPYHDYQDLIFQRASMNNYQLSASGGTDKVQYAVSGGYLGQNGIIKRSNLDRYTLRANVDINITPRLRMGININPSHSIRQDVNASGHWASNGIINSALAAVPMAPIYSEDGAAYSSQAAISAPYGWPGVPNPIANITEVDNQYSYTNLLTNAYAEYQIFDDLEYRVSGNVNLNNTRRDIYQTSKLPLNQLLPPNQATASTSSEQGINWVFNQTLNYNKNINEMHDLDVLIGMETYKLQYKNSLASGTTFASDIVPTLNAAGQPTSVSSSEAETSTLSYFGRVSYDYDDRYLLNASIRLDGSSVFGPENRWGTFPAGSVGWRLSEEPFMESFTFLSETKLRASYGLSGNNAFDTYYPYIASIGEDNYSFNGNLVTGLGPSSLGNAELGWEKSRQLDVGIDLGLFDQRIYFSVDYYNRTTTDLLLAVNVPTITGFSTAFTNIGEMENKGWEFALNTDNLTGQLLWETNLNLSFNRNEVLELGPNGDPIRSGSGIGQTNITQIGSPIGNFYGFKQLGVFQDEADLQSYPHYATARPGDVKYEDVNGDGEITADDRTIIGNNQPDFVYGVTNTFAYSGFDLSVSLYGQQGGEVLNLSRRFIEQLEGNQNQLTTVLNRWRSPEDLGDGVTPRANSRTTGNNNAVSSRWVEDASFLRVQNITLGYQLPQNFIERIRLQQARIYLSGQNLYTWTEYLGYNPEVSGYEGALTGGVDYGAYPLPRTVTLGVNIGF
ncbi:SusC/RagA family TonB-linked outer membrane protein [Salegentibacter salegens]|uniref:TonB-linked outer membrane protein, SusC/RagA family n=1 Tax=Salegentibacter salegens TaxID=143223 RepID=A0A1M7IHZ9_9FLAO|nr:TonB-dependent receptor [Salegentibacter salegens]PRX38994.1 TonB-linked SusC/RagA family outer membrane protein [Salegentibacter salegens]SHM40456.1 TonB-linked outer membrane protein, SusC/RagA family [Salegentibacter salegens]